MRLLLLAAALVLPVLAGCTSPVIDADGEDVFGDHGPAPEITGATDWLRSGPLSLDALSGQVVLVDFWTYSCINCIRTLPHITSWYDTYSDHGLVVVGVHSPEFAFEEEKENVLEAMDRHAIHYPVAQDNDFSVWRAYDNHYWPAKYLIDADGTLRYYHFGEGAYATTEQHIRTLLVEAGATDLPDPVEGEGGTGVRDTGVTPELYAGYGRQDWTLGNAEGYRPGEDVAYRFPDSTTQHLLYLDGTFHNGEEALTARTESSVLLTFRGGAANFVADFEGACIPVRLDGEAIPADVAGPDVDLQADPPCIPLDGARAYDFYRGPVETHTVALRVPPGFALYTFAFSSLEDGGME